jgi:hypothetical protein
MVSLALVRIPSQPCPLPLRPGYCRPSLVMDFPYRCRLFPVPTRPRLVSLGCKPVREIFACSLDRVLARGSGRQLHHAHIVLLGEPGQPSPGRSVKWSSASFRFLGAITQTTFALLHNCTKVEWLKESEWCG